MRLVIKSITLNLQTLWKIFWNDTDEILHKKITKKIIKMFTDVANLLNFLEHDDSQSLCIGVSEKDSDSSFIFHHFLSSFLKKDTNVVLISFLQAFNHFNGVANKIGNNLTKAKEQKQFLFVEGLKNLAQAVNPDCVSGDDPWRHCVDNNGELNVVTFLKTLTTVIDEFSTDSSKSVAIIIDSVSPLQDLGVSTKDITILLHYLKLYAENKNESSLVVGCRNHLGETNEEANLIVNYVQHLSDVMLEVRGLETGYCSDVHGQIIAEWNSRMSRKRTSVKTAQYKLTDKTCAVFASGMSSAVL